MGAAAGLKDTAERAIKDSYGALRALIQRKYSEVDLAHVESAPESAAHRAVVAEDLRAAGAIGDEEVIEQAEALLSEIEKHAPEAAPAIGVDLEKVKAGTLTIEDIVASGTGVKAKDVEVASDITVKGIRAGKEAGPSGKA